MELFQFLLILPINETGVSFFFLATAVSNFIKAYNNVTIYCSNRTAACNDLSTSINFLNESLPLTTEKLCMPFSVGFIKTV